MGTIIALTSHTCCFPLYGDLHLNKMATAHAATSTRAWAASGGGAHLGHGGVAPQAQLVLAEAVARQQLPLVPVPLKRAHLPSR